MSHTTFQQNAADGISLFGQAWMPSGEPKAIIALIHGLGEHTSRYAHVADFLNQNGYALVAYDRRGHGKSKGVRGHSPSYDALLAEVDITLNKARELAPGKPIYLYGHSWGGNIVANYLVRKQPDIAGAVLTGSWLELPQKPPGFKVFLAKMMNNIYPAFTENNGLKTSDLSHDQAIVTAYEEDHLVHAKISARLFLVSTEAAAYALENAGRNDLRTLVMHGGDDAITSPEGSKKFAKMSGGDTTLKIWDGFYHEIHNETHREQVLAYLLDWLEAGNPPA